MSSVFRAIAVILPALDGPSERLPRLARLALVLWGALAASLAGAHGVVHDPPPPGVPAATDAALAPVWADNGDGRAQLWPGPEPSYGATLAIEVGTEAASFAAERWVDGEIVSTLWVTERLGAGAHRLRWRWVVDGAPGAWSGWAALTITDRPLETTRSLSWDDPTTGVRERITLTIESAAGGGPVPVGRFVDGEPYAVAPEGVRVVAAWPTRSQGFRLRYRAGTARFSRGVRLTGARSGATAQIVAIDGDATAGTLVLDRDALFEAGEPIAGSRGGAALARGTIRDHARLGIRGGTARFQAGEVVTGGASGARATVLEATGGVERGTLRLEDWAGFRDGEALSGDRGGAALADGAVDLRRVVNHGETVDIDLNRHAAASGPGYRPSRAYALGTTIRPGQTFLKSASTSDAATRDRVELLATLTVLSRRPPARSFRPPPYVSASKRMLSEAQVDLAMVPRLPRLGRPGSFDPAEQDRFRRQTMQYPAPPLAGGSAGSRAMFPESAASQYHRTIREDWAVASYLVMSPEFDDRTAIDGPDGIRRSRRALVANALIQRMIDHIGHGESAAAFGQSPSYHWAVASAFAGTVARDDAMRNAHHWGRVRTDYMFDTKMRGTRLHAWAEFEAARGTDYDPSADPTTETALYRDLDHAGSDWTRGAAREGRSPTVVWDALLAPRRVAYPSRTRHAARLEALGFVNNHDDTWTIPANRDLLGKTVTVSGAAFGYPQGDALLLEYGFGDSRISEPPHGAARVADPLLEGGMRQLRWAEAAGIFVRGAAPNPAAPGLPDERAYRRGSRSQGVERRGRVSTSGAHAAGGAELAVTGLAERPPVGSWVMLLAGRTNQGYHLRTRAEGWRRDRYWGTYRVEGVSRRDPATGGAVLTLDQALATDVPDGTPVLFRRRYQDTPYHEPVAAGPDRGKLALKPGATLSEASWWARGWLDRLQNFGRVVGSDAAPSPSATPAKIGNIVYYWQHAPQVAMFAPLLRALPSKGYLTTDTAEIAKYETFAREWMLMPRDWPLAAGFDVPGAYRGSGFAFAGARGTGDAMYYPPDGWQWIEDIWWPAFSRGAPRIAARPPHAVRLQDVAVALPREPGAAATLTIRSLPHDGFAPITDLEISLAGGPWRSLGIFRPGETASVRLAPGRTALALRAVNEIGPGAEGRWELALPPEDGQ